MNGKVKENGIKKCNKLKLNGRQEDILTISFETIEKPYATSKFPRSARKEYCCYNCARLLNKRKYGWNESSEGTPVSGDKLLWVLSKYSGINKSEIHR